MATQRKRKRTAGTTNTRRRKNNGSGRKFALYASILVIGAIGIVIYNQYSTKAASLSLPTLTNTAHKNTSKRAFVEPDYQFYTLLPQGNKPSAATTMPTVTPTKPAKSTAAVTPAPTTAAAKTVKAMPAKGAAPISAATPTPLPPAANHHYQLQLAAFKRYEDADELKAKLILQGYPTTINSANVKGTVWYRLWIGPYNTTQQAKSVQAKLEQTHLVSHTQVVQQ